MKKLVAVVLFGALMVSAAGCSALSLSKLSEKKMESFAKDNKAEEMDTDDIADAIDDDDYDDLEDGVWFKSSGKDFSEFLEDPVQLDQFIAIPSKVDSATGYAIANEDDEEIFFAIVMQLPDEKKADKILDDSVDLWDEFAKNAKDWAIADEEENERLAHLEMDAYDDTIDITLAAYKEKTTVMIIVAVNSDKMVGKCCDYFKVDDPTEVLKNDD